MWTTTLIVLFVVLILITLWFVFSIVFYGKKCENPLRKPDETKQLDDTEEFYHK